jgi:hypothetical protein
MNKFARHRSQIRPLRPADLAQPRDANLPTGGRYNHVTQELEGYNSKFAKGAMISSTQFDGERS